MDPIVELLVRRYGMSERTAKAYALSVKGVRSNSGDVPNVGPEFAGQLKTEALNEIAVPNALAGMQQVGPAAWRGYADTITSQPPPPPEWEPRSVPGGFRIGRNISAFNPSAEPITPPSQADKADLARSQRAMRRKTK